MWNQIRKLFGVPDRQSTAPSQTPTVSPPKEIPSNSRALMEAAQAGDLEGVRRVIASGADVRGQEGATSVVLAAQDGFHSVVKLLLDGGADVNAKAADGASAIFLASQDGHAQVIALLVANGADTNTPRRDLVTPLMIAVQNGHDQITEMLLSAGADPNATGPARTTALMIAAKYDQAEGAKMLLAQGARTVIERSDGLTAYALAKQAGHKDIATLLEASGAIVGEPTDIQEVRGVINAANPIADLGLLKNFIAKSPCGCGGTWEGYRLKSRYASGYITSDCRCQACHKLKRFTFVL